jgi:glutamine kinase
MTQATNSIDQMNVDDAIKPFEFLSKALTLSALSKVTHKAIFCDQVIIEKSDWIKDPDAQVQIILDTLSNVTFAVRSSAASEDLHDVSNAGAYLSLTSVAPQRTELASAIARVFESYLTPHLRDQVLVQPMVQNVALSGVVLTRELDSGGPYYVINYDDTTGRTDTVTGGAESKTVLVHRSKPKALKSPRLRKLIEDIKEIEAITNSEHLDIEFCITSEDVSYILQVRPLAARHKWSPLPDGAVDKVIDGIRKKLFDVLKPEHDLSGQTSILAEMTDWNPAEMIGTTPKPLALSLYKYLITDAVWAQARDAMGYKFIEGPLLIDLHGRPFIDVRRSFNSFLPAGISDRLANRLVNHQLTTLAAHPNLHDKVEFEIAFTCRDFSFETGKEKLKANGFSIDEINEFETALGALTNNILEAGSAQVDALIEQSNKLLEDAITVSNVPILTKIGRLLDACREYGTLPFAQLARHGFIGVLMLKSLVERRVFTETDMNQFMGSIHTVAADVVNAMHNFSTGAINAHEFFSEYGHLRPGTYDILSWRYDEQPELFMGRQARASIATEPFILLDEKRSKIQYLLNEYKIALSPEAFLAYIAAAIRGREQAKFAFSKAISNALKLLTEWGSQHGISRDELSFLTLDDISPNLELDQLKTLVSESQQEFLLTRAIRLPHMITDPADIDVVRMPLGQPTFITNNSVTGNIKKITNDDMSDIAGHIVMIEGADPGFDWIFSHNILGLVTMFGGANSHMAIRCAEFGLPAALGCGERLFEELAKASVIELNCAARKVTKH